MSFPENANDGQPNGAGGNPAAAPAAGGFAAAPAKLASANSARPPAPPAALASAPNVIALLRALRRRWILALSLALVLGPSGAAAVWFCLPPAKNTANVHMAINADVAGKVYPHPDKIGDSFEAYQSLQVHHLRSRMVLNAALRQPGINQLSLFQKIPEAERVEWLEKEIRIDFPSREVIRVTFAGDDLDDLKTLTNAVAKAYIAEIIEKQTKERGTRLEELRGILGKYRERLASCRRLNLDLAKRSNSAGGGIDSKSQSLMMLLLREQLASASKQLVTVKNDIRELVVKEQLASLKADQAVPDHMIASQVDQEPAIISRVQNIAAAEQLFEETRKQAADPNDLSTPALRKIRNDIDNYKILVASERSRLRTQWEAKLKEVSSQTTEQSLATIRANLAHAKALEKTLEADVQKLNHGIDEAPTLVQSMRENEFEIEQLESEVKTLTTKAGELEIEMGDAPRVKVQQEAVAYKGDNLARRVQMSVATGVLLIGLSVVGVALLEFRTRRVSTVDEVTQGLGVRVVGTVPACPKKVRKGVVSTGKMTYWKNMLTESVDAARTLLLHYARREDLRIIMVTSACGGEGKTSLSSHLAVSMARSGRKTLLIDCDLRNPSAHKLFNVPLEPGLSSVLRGEIPVEDALHPTQATGLFLMPAGACDAEALSMLAQDGVQPVFDRLRTEFDFIVVDSSPVLPVADSLMVAQQVDGVLFAILREVSRLPKVHEAYQKLSTLGVRMIGAVVNGTSGAVYGSGGYASNSRYLTPTTKS